MRSFLVLTVFVSLSVTGFSQPSDFISVKKRNNRTLKSYFTGSAISCQTVYGNYLGGIVNAIRNDSVFIKEYDVRSVPNMWGVAKTDTLGTYVVGIHYKDIEVVNIKKAQSFGYVRDGTLLMVGGLGYAVLNLVNGKYLNESITVPENRKSLGIAVGVAGAGFLMNRIHNYSNNNKRRYRVEYIRMEIKSL